MKRSIPIAVLAVAALLAVAVAAPLSSSGATGPQAEIAKKCRSKQKKKVKVGDNFFSPTKLGIRRCGKVKWKWLPTNFQNHNVTLTKGPKKVNKNKFTSATGSIGIKFARRFKRTGSYRFICTIHPTSMQMTVKVKNKR